MLSLSFLVHCSRYFISYLLLLFFFLSNRFYFFVFSFRRTGCSKTVVAVFDEGRLLLIFISRSNRRITGSKEQRMRVMRSLSLSLSLSISQSSFHSILFFLTLSHYLAWFFYFFYFFYSFINYQRLVVIERTWRRNDIIYSTRCTYIYVASRAYDPRVIIVTDLSDFLIRKRKKISGLEYSPFFLWFA